MSTTPDPHPFRPIPVDRLFTFGVVYVVDGETLVEELDVEAGSEVEAKAAAEAMAAAELEPGWDRIVILPRGGSGGLVTF